MLGRTIHKWAAVHLSLSTSRVSALKMPTPDCSLPWWLHPTPERPTSTLSPMLRSCTTTADARLKECPTLRRGLRQIPPPRPPATPHAQANCPSCCGYMPTLMPANRVAKMHADELFMRRCRRSGSRPALCLASRFVSPGVLTAAPLPPGCCAFQGHVGCRTSFEGHRRAELRIFGARWGGEGKPKGGRGASPWPASPLQKIHPFPEIRTAAKVTADAHPRRDPSRHSSCWPRHFLKPQSHHIPAESKYKG